MRLNHMELTFPRGTLDVAFRKEVDDFYGEVFGWTGKYGEDPMKYWHWQNAGKDIGGMMKLMMPDVPPNWLAYLATDDVDASALRVTQLGGKVMMPALDIPKVGKFSVVADPTGGVFALFKSAPR